MRDLSRIKPQISTGLTKKSGRVTHSSSRWPVVRTAGAAATAAHHGTGLMLHQCLVGRVASSHLGRDAEAREAAARVLEFDPAFTISAWLARGGSSNAKLLIEGLRKAGLPE
jgi:hypothetical protein